MKIKVGICSPWIKTCKKEMSAKEMSPRIGNKYRLETYSLDLSIQKSDVICTFFLKYHYSYPYQTPHQKPPTHNFFVLIRNYACLHFAGRGGHHKSPVKGKWTKPKRSSMVW